MARAGGLPDDESLNAGGWTDPPYDTSVEGWWRFAFDHHRSVAGGAHQGGENEISSELGATALPLQLTLHNYKQLMDNEWAAGLTRPIPHGYNYQVAGDEWPGTSRFGGFVSETWNAETYPQWPMWEPLADYWARGAQVLQSGTARADVAILYDGFVTTAAAGFEATTAPEPLFEALSIEELGYRVEYVDSAGVAEPQAQGDGTLYPDGPQYGALVVDQDALAPETAEAMAEQAERGLAIVFVGDPPDHAATYAHPAAANKRVRDAVERMLATPAVTQVERQSDAGPALAELGVRPDVRWRAPTQAYTQHRETSTADYYYVYNPTPSPISFRPSFEATGRPRELDLWTGEISPVAEYRARARRVTVPLSLEPGENVVLGFRKGDRPSTPHVVRSDAENVVDLGDGRFEVRDTRAGKRSLRFSDGDVARVRVPKLPPIQRPTDWDLIVAEAGPEDEPPTHDLDLVGLPDWRSIEELEDASGTGTYTTTVTLPGRWTARKRGGTYLDIGRVAGGSTQVYVNGHLASPSPVAEERIDVSSPLRRGDNEIEVVFASTLRNKQLAVDGEDGPGQAYGLRGPVRLIPFGRATVRP